MMDFFTRVLAVFAVMAVMVVIYWAIGVGYKATYHFYYEGKVKATIREVVHTDVPHVARDFSDETCAICHAPSCLRGSAYDSTSFRRDEP